MSQFFCLFFYSAFLTSIQCLTHVSMSFGQYHVQTWNLNLLRNNLLFLNSVFCEFYLQNHYYAGLIQWGTVSGKGWKQNINAITTSKDSMKTFILKKIETPVTIRENKKSNYGQNIDEDNNKFFEFNVVKLTERIKLWECLKCSCQIIEINVQHMNFDQPFISVVVNKGICSALLKEDPFPEDETGCFINMFILEKCK